MHYDKHGTVRCVKGKPIHEKFASEKKLFCSAGIVSVAPIETLGLFCSSLYGMPILNVNSVRN